MNNDIVSRLRGPGIADYELDCGVAEDAAKEIERLREALETIRLATCDYTASDKNSCQAAHNLATDALRQ